MYVFICVYVYRCVGVGVCAGLCMCVLVYTVFPQNIQPAPSTAQPSRVSFHRPTLRSGRDPITLSPQAQLALVTAGSAVRSLFWYGKYVRTQCGCNAFSIFVFALVQLCLGEAGRQEAQARTGEYRNSMGCVVSLGKCWALCSAG